MVLLWINLMIELVQHVPLDSMRMDAMKVKLIVLINRNMVEPMLIESQLYRLMVVDYFAEVDDLFECIEQWMLNPYNPFLKYRKLSRQEKEMIDVVLFTKSIKSNNRSLLRIKDHDILLRLDT